MSIILQTKTRLIIEILRKIQFVRIVVQKNKIYVTGSENVPL